MATYYSILSVHIRPEIQEKISIGFLLVGEGKVFFNFSRNKLLAAKGLLPDTSFRLLKDSLKNIETTAAIESNKDNAQLLLNDSLKKNTFSVSYIDYLSRYNNNVLSFSTPKKIDIQASEEIYDQLFNKFIDDSETVTAISKTNNVDRFKANNKVQLVKHFNVDREFTSIEIPKLIAPVKVDLLGKNEIPVYVQAVDLDKMVYHIEYELAQLAFLNLAFNEEEKPAKGFVLSREPDKKEFKQHNIWKQLRSSKQFEYIDLSEPEKILEYAKKHGVQPLVADISE
jgi:hypothetical protein